jgi:hypothetical protein
MLIPNIPYEDLGDCLQIAIYHAAWVMRSSQKSIHYLALANIRPQHCCELVRQADYRDIQALASGLPMLPQRRYQIGTEQGFVSLDAVLIDREASALPNRQYQWVATLEPPIAHKINNPPAVVTKKNLYHSPSHRKRLALHQ